jgi:ribosomal protein L37AE/L43A
VPIPACPSCGDLKAVVANERLDVKTFYCSNCEHDWEDQAAAPPETPPSDGESKGVERDVDPATRRQQP